jgi:SAM-dependent methyltransferase
LTEALRELRGQPVLDLGVGTGRTTPLLLQLSEDHVGLDYAPEMIRLCRERFPGVSMVVGDARAMPDFADGRFALVVFSFNGIDMVDDEDRLKVLAEVRRVLRPGGAFLFSSHNLGYRVPRPWSLSHLRFTPNPYRQARVLARYLAGIGNHPRRRRLERRGPDWAIRNDEAHRYRVMSYAIGPDAQRAQLAAAGFGEVRVVTPEAAALAQGERTTAPWLHYLARR